MLSIEHIKKLLNDENISDEQVELIRDGFHQLAELIYQDWLDKNKQKHDHKNIE